MVWLFKSHVGCWLTASAPQRSSRSTEESWGPSAGPPPGSCSSPETCGSVYSGGTVRPDPLYPHLFCSPHFQLSPAKCFLHRWRRDGGGEILKRKKNGVKQQPAYITQRFLLTLSLSFNKDFYHLYLLSGYVEHVLDPVFWRGQTKKKTKQKIWFNTLFFCVLISCNQTAQKHFYRRRWANTAG